MVRVTIEAGPIQHSENITMGTAQRVREFLTRYRQEGETAERFVNRVMTVFENLAAPTLKRMDDRKGGDVMGRGLA